jgi:DNA-binding HxlR family transcriptional regulator
VARQNALAKERQLTIAQLEELQSEQISKLRKANPKERSAYLKILRELESINRRIEIATNAEAGQAPAKAQTLDQLIHERTRLAIVSALAVNQSLTFNDLKQMLNTTDGNLSVHARKLEEANYITCNKFFDGRMPKTEYRLTTAGRRALEQYLNHMEAIIRKTREG